MTYVQMSVKCIIIYYYIIILNIIIIYYFQRIFGLKAEVFIMNVDYAVVRDLVILNGTVY